MTQIGLFIVPVIDGKILNEDDFIKLEEEKKQEIQQKREKINDDLKKTMDLVRDLDKKLNETIKKLNYDVALYSIEKFIYDLKENIKKSLKLKNLLMKSRKIF